MDEQRPTGIRGCSLVPRALRLQTVRVGAGLQAGPSGSSLVTGCCPGQRTQRGQYRGPFLPGAKPWPRGDARSHLAPSLRVDGADLPPGGKGLGRAVGLEQGLSPSPCARPVHARRPCPACPSVAQTSSWTLGHQGQAPRKWPCLRWPLGALSLTLIGTCGPQVLHPSPAPTQGDCVQGGLWPWPCLLPSFSCSQGLLPPALESW